MHTSFFSHSRSYIVLLCAVSLFLFAPVLLFAQEGDVDVNETSVEEQAIDETMDRAEREVEDALPEQVAGFFGNIVGATESFRIEYASTIEAKRDEQRAFVEERRREFDERMQEVEEEILDIDSGRTTLVQGAGSRFSWEIFTRNIYAGFLGAYGAFFTYPILFYASLIILLLVIIGRIYALVTRRTQYTYE